MISSPNGIVDDTNHLLDELRGYLADAEVDLVEKKETRRVIKEMKDVVDADYEYSS